MSYAPRTLLDLSAYLKARGVPVVGIVGDTNHTYGYHLGRDRLPGGDYSATLYRDKVGLTNAASALDVGDHGGLRALTNYLALAGARGDAPDVREVIGPGMDGRAYRWAAENDFNREGPRARGDSHEWHCHVSYYRDSEYRDKIALYRAYYEGDSNMGDINSSQNMPLTRGSWVTTHPSFADRPKVQDGLLTSTWTTETWAGVEELTFRLVPQVLAKLEQLSAPPQIDYERLAKAVVDEFYARNTPESA